MFVYFWSISSLIVSCYLRGWQTSKSRQIFAETEPWKKKKTIYTACWTEQIRMKSPCRGQGWGWRKRGRVKVQNKNNIGRVKYFPSVLCPVSRSGQAWKSARYTPVSLLWFWASRRNLFSTHTSWRRLFLSQILEQWGPHDMYEQGLAAIGCWPYDLRAFSHLQWL